MLYRLRVPGALVRLARTRAEAEDTTLEAVVIEALTRYADGDPSPAAELGARGGRASAQALTATERRDKGQRAAAARWRDHPRGS